MTSPLDPCPACGHPRDGAICRLCGGAPADRRLERRARAVHEQVSAGLVAPFVGLGALFELRGVKRWIVPPTVASALVLVGLLLWLWEEIASWTSGGERVDLDMGWFSWMETPVEWVVNLPWMRSGGVLAFVLVAALVWWFGYAIVFEVLAGPFLSRMHGRAEEHWLGGAAKEGDPFESRGLLITMAAASLGALGAWIAFGAFGGVAALAMFAAPLVVALLLLPRFRTWFVPFVATEGRSALQGLVVAGVALVGMVLFLPFHLVPVVGSWIAAGGAGFFLALGSLDLALDRRGWSLDRRFGLARRRVPALLAFGALCAFLFGVPVIGPLVMLPAASLGGAWLVCKLDKGDGRISGPPPLGSARAGE
ncbi:MAG: EI24 domain-containing protein [Planctomycetota bacterium]